MVYYRELTNNIRCRCSPAKRPFFFQPISCSRRAGLRSSKCRSMFCAPLGTSTVKFFLIPIRISLNRRNMHKDIRWKLLFSSEILAFSQLETTLSVGCFVRFNKLKASENLKLRALSKMVSQKDYIFIGIVTIFTKRLFSLSR